MNQHAFLSVCPAVFQHQPVQFSPLEEDADRDDDPCPPDVEETGEEEELQRLSRRPWGASKHYCPVVLRDQEVLWPGNPDHALRYRDRLYYFSTEEAKQTFEECAEKYAKFVQKVNISCFYTLAYYSARQSVWVYPTYFLSAAGVGGTVHVHKNQLALHTIFHTGLYVAVQSPACFCT